MAPLKVSGLEARCGGFRLGPMDFQVEAGEFFAVVGPTGAGKTMLLEALAGLVELDSGKISFNGMDITGLPPEQRPISIVYQDFSLFPHLDVRRNIEFGLRYLKKRGGNGNIRAGGSDLIDELMERLGISHLAGRAVLNLSGGEKQRVALARALAVQPKILLLDEPLSSLDPASRNRVRGLLSKIHREFGMTTIMVTHDFSDLFALAHRVAVMNQGGIEQTGTVRGLFSDPAAGFVSDFIKGALSDRKGPWPMPHEEDKETEK